MNSFQFSVLFLTASLACFVHGFINPIVYNSGLYLPLLSAGSGGLGTVLAALGALKLGAVALVLLDQQEADEKVKQLRSRYR